MTYHVVVDHHQRLTYAVEAASQQDARETFEAGASQDFEEVDQDCLNWEIVGVSSTK